MHFTKILNQEFQQKLKENLPSIPGGTENLAPYLYFLIKILKPLKILEIGAGYSSVFFAKALADNKEELKFDHELINIEKKNVDNKLLHRKKILNENYNYTSYDPKIYIIDNFSKKDDPTANPVKKALNDLHLNNLVEFHEANAFNFKELKNIIDPIKPLDFVFLDLAAGHSLPILYKFIYPFVHPLGGHIIVHSTLTNAIHRLWLADLKLKQKISNDFEIMSFYEPNKIFQNSFTLIQKNEETFNGEFYPPVFTPNP